MKILKLSAVLAITWMSFSVCIAQEKKEAAKPAETKEVKSNGNAEAMRRNLNYPNATNPADKNNQKYDKGTGRVDSEHPKENQSNSYNRKQIEGGKK